MTEPGTTTEPAPTGGRLLLLTLLLAAIATAVFYFSARRDADGADQSHAAIVSALENSRRTADAERVRTACAGRAAGSCACRQEAAARALDRDLHAEAVAVLAGDPKCASPGLEAEALARSNRADEAITLAGEVLAAAPTDGHAAYALAHAHYSKGDAARALEAARRAVEARRGAPAHLLAGLIAYHANDLTAAKHEFDRMLALDPDDVDAHYNLAVVAGRENRYRDSREGYLRVLRLSPRHFDARHNLALLTHWAGATTEAKHHLEKLEAVADKDDERVTRLRAALAAPPQGVPAAAQGQVEGGAR
jgi:tetratricopeptide (TPR) repeat protein